MSYSVLTAKSELEPMLHGTTLNQIGNVDGVFNRAARQLLLDIDPVETKRVAQLSRIVYAGVFPYAPPTDLKKDKIVDLSVAYQPLYGGQFVQTYNRYFNRTKSITPVNTCSILNDTGVKTLEISYVNSTRTVVLNQATAISGNGMWAASGTASNLSVDNQTIVNNGTPLMFDLTTGTGYLTNSTMTATDLTLQENQAGIFWKIICPTAANLTSMEIRFGSDASNYWEATGITTDFAGNAFKNGLNQIYTLWGNMTQVGSPDVTAVDYVRVGFTVSGAITGMEFTYLTVQLGWYMDIEYYSRYLFSDAITGAWQETVTDDSNLINLDTDSYNIFLYLVHFFSVQQALGQDAQYDTIFSDTGYRNALERYKRMYKSEIIKPQQPYYTRTFNGYNGWLGQNYDQY